MYRSGSIHGQITEGELMKLKKESCSLLIDKARGKEENVSLVTGQKADKGKQHVCLLRIDEKA